MNPASNLVLVGPMGAGKTAIGRRLAGRLGLAFADSDQEVERQAGASVAAIFEHVGEAGFRERERRALAGLLAGSGRLVATGGGAVLDADNRRLMGERGFVVWLQAGPDTQLRRLARDRSRPLLLRQDRAQVLRQLAAARDPLYREVADLVLSTDGIGPGQAVLQLAQLLSQQWQRDESTA